MSAELNQTDELKNLFAAHNEWLFISSSGKTFSLQNSEIEIEIERNKVLLSFPTDEGFQTWRIKNYEIENKKITFDLTRNFNRETEKMTFVPRTSAGELLAETELARIEKANKISKFLIENFPQIKLVRVALNQENGRLANIIIEKNNRQIAVLADVSELATPENLLTSAIFWLRNLENRRKNQVGEIWILANKKTRRDLQRIHALLRDGWKRKIILFDSEAKNKNSALKIEKLKTLEIMDLWREKPNKIALTEKSETSRTAQEIVKLAPDKIDVMFNKNGETLRYLGLPFVRIRKSLSVEKVWFGIEKEKRILSDKNLVDFEKLLDDLKIYRSFASPNKRHALYKFAPEAWLEALLRRNIKLLDANLILSPLYNQFRTARDKIDLLALRNDGRLIIIELKAAPDREMPFQAIDYWRKIELQRHKGILNQARIFGEKQISDAPALVYLVAPALCFHRDFPFLTNTISDKIGVYRFELNHDWRETLNVISRLSVSENRFEKL